MANVILIIFVLSTQSSYSHDGEHPASASNYDTIQWWITADGSFRISTFALTNDIHIYQFDARISPNQAIENTHKHYGDIIASEHILDIQNLEDSATISQQVMSELGKGSIELISRPKTGFWNYDGRRYSTQTEP